MNVCALPRTTTERVPPPPDEHAFAKCRFRSPGDDLRGGELEWLAGYG